MKQTAIPFLFMRGGTSRGPYMLRGDLPKSQDLLADVLVAAIGAGHSLNIDGIGGGATVTNKVAMISKSDVDGVDIDFFFAQVDVESRAVDFTPTCGNILSGVGPAAIELGLLSPTGDETSVRIRAVNTDALVIARVQTPGDQVRYDGDSSIDGVPGTAAPVDLSFSGVVGSVTGAMLPTGRLIDEIDGVTVTCMDVAMPVVIAQAAAMGLSGYESREQIEANRDFFQRMELLRLEAGRLMGMGDVTNSVTPKFAIMAPPRFGGDFSARYFTPWSCHPTMAVSGAQCLAACALTPGTVAQGVLAHASSPSSVRVEHASGAITVSVSFTRKENRIEIQSTGHRRTARLLARGELYVPTAVWRGTRAL